ncbi:MAG: EamA family transporter RarD [Myxococcota bacterium]
MSERRTGIVYALLAYGIWGGLPLYLRQVRHVPPLQVLAHRIVWSFGLLLVLMLVGQEARRQAWARLRAEPRVLLTFVATAIALTINWFVYIWAVDAGRVIDGSLGYFINPLFSVVLAVVVLKERLRSAQWAAVAIAGLGVLWLTLLAGQLPWIGLTLAVSFGFYGLLRKTAALAALSGLALETALLFPLALAYLAFVHHHADGVWTHASTRLRFFLVLAGPLTALPLLSFAAGARRIPLSLLGILQYIGPSLQFLLGIAVFKEEFAPKKLVGFALIWLSLLLYSLESILFARSRAAQREA